MPFNDGFTSRTIDSITGSEGEVLTIVDGIWTAAAGGGGGGITEVVTTGNITGSGTSGNPVTLKDNINVQQITASNILINGTASIAILNTVNQQNLQIGDKYITILSGSNNHLAMDGAGILYGSGSGGITTGELGSVAHILYRKDPLDKIEIFPGLKVSGSIISTAVISGTFNGEGSNINNILVDNIPNFNSSVISTFLPVEKEVIKEVVVDNSYKPNHFSF